MTYTQELEKAILETENFLRDSRIQMQGQAPYGLLFLDKVLDAARKYLEQIT